MYVFYLEPSRWQAPFCLTGQEARHASKVLRLTSGNQIRLMDGQGRIGVFIISSVAASQIVLEALQIQEYPKPAGRCFLAAAYTKAARRGFMLEKAVELGAGGIWFWQAERSQIKVPAEAGSHWKEQLIAGLKQSQNPWLPELASLPGGAQAVCAAAGRFSKHFLLWEEAGSGHMLTSDDLALTGDTLFVMGPEGGLSRAEADLFQTRGFRPVSLGKRILRWETAAVLSLGLSWWAGQVKAGQETS